MNGCECASVSMPGACACGALLAFSGHCMAGSPLIIKDLDLYPQPPTNTWSPTLNSEEPNNPLTTNGLFIIEGVVGGVRRVVAG